MNHLLPLPRIAGAKLPGRGAFAAPAGCAGECGLGRNHAHMTTGAVGLGHRVPGQTPRHLHE